MQARVASGSLGGAALSGLTADLAGRVASRIMAQVTPGSKERDPVICTAVSCDCAQQGVLDLNREPLSTSTIHL